MTDRDKAFSNEEERALGIEDFAGRRPHLIGERLFKKFAVLVPLLETPDGTALVFERRSDKLRRQPGEICFPGGKLEPDETPQACAVRETAEELCIPERQIRVYGPGDTFVSPFNLIIYPFIGLLKDYRFTCSPEEVAEVIAVPLDFFTRNSPENYMSTVVSQLPGDFPYERIPGGENYPWATGTHDILFYQYGRHLIWGITALLVRSAVELIVRYRLG
jgi:8-oxo-dGTP pyrophosphatase MutT (NUDIX family)